MSRAASLDEESKALLRQIVERQAHRLLVLSNIRGHGLKYLPGLEGKTALTRDLADGLDALTGLVDLYADLDGGDLFETVRARTERIPYPLSRLELAVCLVLCEAAEKAALESHVDSRCDELAGLCQASLDRERRSAPRGRGLFVEYAVDEKNRAHAQQLFERWLTIALLALGRPGTHGDRRAVALGLRSRGCGETAQAFLADIEPLRVECGLAMPDLSRTGLVLPD